MTDDTDPSIDASDDTLEDVTDSHSLTTWKVLGEIDAPAGTGVYGHNTATTGVANGVTGVADSSATDAAGVLGTTNGTGNVYGVRGVTDASGFTAAGVRAEGSDGALGLFATSGAGGEDAALFRGFGGRGFNASSNGADGAFLSTNNGNAAGAFAKNFATNNTGSRGRGFKAETNSTGLESAGLYGEASESSGQTYGVHGVTNSPATDAAGVRGEAAAGSGTTHGVYGTTASSDGFAVYADGASKTAGSHEVTGDATLGGTITRDIGAKIGLDKSQTIQDMTGTRVEFENVIQDDRGEYDKNNHKFIAARAGAYHVTVQLRWSDKLPADSNGNNFVNLTIRKNGGIRGYNRKVVGVPGYLQHNFSQTLRNVSAGDDLTVQVYQNTDGSSKDLQSGDSWSSLAVDYLGTAPN